MTNMALRLLALVPLCSSALAYKVSVERLSQSPVISKETTGGAFDYFYNPASFTVTTANGTAEHWLMVRCQNKTSPNSSAWSYGGPSVFAVVRERDAIGTQFYPLTAASIVFGDGVHDVEDPRIVFHNGIYYMTYTQSDMGCKAVSGNPCARLALASSPNPLRREWTIHGALWPDVAGFQWTKSGAIIPASAHGQPHVMLFGAWCTYHPWVSPLYMQVAVSNNMLDWTILPGFAMDKRTGRFDSYVIEPGPPPVRLSDGHLLFLYNGAKECPTGKPDYDRCYAIGWAILNGTDPAQVLARAEEPVLSPVLPWEIGVAARGDQTPSAVFIDGALRIDRGAGRKDVFVAHYGGSDTYVGAARVVVDSVSSS